MSSLELFETTKEVEHLTTLAYNYQASIQLEIFNKNNAAGFAIT